MERSKWNYRDKYYQDYSMYSSNGILQFQTSKIICPFIEISVRRFRDWIFSSTEYFSCFSFSFFGLRNTWSPSALSGTVWGQGQQFVCCLFCAGEGKVQSFDKVGWRSPFIFLVSFCAEGFSAGWKSIPTILGLQVELTWLPLHHFVL